MTNEYKILGDLQVFVCVGGEAAASRLLQLKFSVVSFMYRCCRTTTLTNISLMFSTSFEFA